MEPHRLHNGHYIYATNPEKCHFCHEFRLDYESCWESVSYVAEKAYDARDIGGLFFDGMTVAIMRHFEVAVPIICLVAGGFLGLFLLVIAHKKGQKNE